MYIIGYVILCYVILCYATLDFQSSHIPTSLGGIWSPPPCYFSLTVARSKGHVVFGVIYLDIFQFYNKFYLYVYVMKCYTQKFCPMFRLKFHFRISTLVLSSFTKNEYWNVHVQNIFNLPSSNPW